MKNEVESLQAQHVMTKRGVQIDSDLPVNKRV